MIKVIILPGNFQFYAQDSSRNDYRKNISLGYKTSAIWDLSMQTKISNFPFRLSDKYEMNKIPPMDINLTVQMNNEFR